MGNWKFSWNRWKIENIHKEVEAIKKNPIKIIKFTDTVIGKKKKQKHLTEWAQYQSRDNRGYNQLTFFFKRKLHLFIYWRNILFIEFC